MKRTWVIPWGVAVVAGVLAYGLARHAPCGRSVPALDCLKDVSWLVRELRLTDGQANAIRDLQASLGARLNDCCARHCEARARLGRVLVSGTNGAAEADALVAEMSREYEKSERATLDHIRAVRAVLNAGQRERFDAMVVERTCGACTMRGGACDPPH